MGSCFARPCHRFATHGCGLVASSLLHKIVLQRQVLRQCTKKSGISGLRRTSDLPRAAGGGGGRAGKKSNPLAGRQRDGS